MPGQAAKTPQKRKGLTLAIIVLVAMLAGFIAYYFNAFDYAKAAFFQPSAEISSLMDRIDLTDAGTRVFKASSPALESRDEFNNNCSSIASGDNSYVLGCYITSADKIHIYDVKLTDETKDLEGVVEATAAHELLHAVWDRMPFWEKTAVQSDLKTVYDHAGQDFKGEFDLYGSNEFYDELHSRVGTEIAPSDLPSSLRRHYASYFKNTDKVVAYYENYNSAFKKLVDRADQLASEVKTLDSEIDTETADYYKQSDALNQEINEFNDCAARQDCFATNAEFQSRRSELVAKIDAIGKTYDALNDKITKFNGLIDEYNSLVVRSKTLQGTIDSKSVTEEVEKV